MKRPLAYRIQPTQRKEFTLSDMFQNAHGAGAINATPATPAPGLRGSVDSESQLSISGGTAIFAGGKASPAWGDPKLFYTKNNGDGWARPTGYASGYQFEFDVTADVDKQCLVGLVSATTSTGDPTNAETKHGMLLNSDGNLDIIVAGATVKADAATLVNGTTYRLRFIVYSAGCFYSISGGAFGTLGVTYTALYENITDTTATLYPIISNYNAVFTLDNVNSPTAEQALTFADYVTGIPLAEARALRQLFRLTTGNGWTNKTGWLSVTAVTTGGWYGITVTGGRVTSLNVSVNNLIGTLPAEIGNLTALTLLYLNNNQFSGTIPSEIGNLTALTVLQLYTNQLTGSIPTEIGNLVLLQNLQLHTNQFSGTIPTEIGNLVLLTYLNLQNNQFSGTLPSEIGNLVLLTQLYLNTNTSLFYVDDFVSPLENLRDLRVQGNEWTQAMSNALLDDIWAARNAYTYASGIVLQMHGTNAAPSGTYQAACPPTTPKEEAYELVNDSCLEGFNNWAITMN